MASETSMMEERNSLPLTIMMSYDLYEKLLALEDAYWGQRAMATAEGGFLGEEETLRELANIAAEKGYRCSKEIS